MIMFSLQFVYFIDKAELFRPIWPHSLLFLTHSRGSGLATIPLTSLVNRSMSRAANMATIGRRRSDLSINKYKVKGSSGYSPQFTIQKIYTYFQCNQTNFVIVLFI